MMNFRNIIPAAAIALAALVSTPVSAQSTQQIRIQNNSGMTLVRFYASASSNNSWENDILGNRVLRNRQFYALTFRNVVDCLYDFRMEFSNGNVVTDQVNICQVSNYTITP